MSAVAEFTSATDMGTKISFNSLECQSDADLATLQSAEYRCARCNAKCPTKLYLVRHMTAVHKLFHRTNGENMNFKLAASFAELAALNQHLLVYQQPQFDCSECPQSFKYKPSLVRHSIRKHGMKRPKNYKCDECGQMFSNVHSLSHHSVRHSPPKFSCNKCDQKFFNWGGLLMHTKIFHLRLMSRVSLKVSKFSCQHCPHKYANADSLKLHLANVHLPKNHKCPHCSKEFPTATPLNNHLLIAHLIKVQPDVKCAICSKVCKDQRGLYGHMKFHGNPTHSCGQCALKFHTSGFLTQHLIQAHTERCAIPMKSNNNKIHYACAVCCRPFGLRKQSLRKHLALHYCKPQICAICQWSFNSEETFRSHMRRQHYVDSSEMIQCEICGKSFINKENYLMHRKYHDKPKLACHDCPRLFYNALSLLNHSNSHNSNTETRAKKYSQDTRVFGCAICSRKFPARYMVKQHLVNTHNPPTFGCSQCHFQCHTKGIISKHLHNFHAVKSM